MGTSYLYLMNELFDVNVPDEKSHALPREIIIIDIRLDPNARVDVRPRFFAAFKNILNLPRPIGRLVFDLLGRHDIADSSSVILGWLVILIAILLFRGFIPFEVLVNWLMSFIPNASP